MPSILKRISPVESPALRAGFMRLPSVEKSVKPTTISPSVNIFMPKGRPDTSTVSRCAYRTRTVFTATPSGKRSSASVIVSTLRAAALSPPYTAVILPGRDRLLPRVTVYSSGRAACQ